MKIAFIGNFEAEFSTENYHKKTFEAMGHQVIPFQENKTHPYEILQIAKDCDMLFYTHTHSWRIGTDEAIRALLSQLKKLNVPTVGYHLDLWMWLEREKDLKRDPYWNIEHFFTVDKLMADYLNENTKTKGYYLPPGVYEPDCFMAEPNREKYPHDIIFTGSKNYHPEHKYRGQLIEWLHNTYGQSFAHYGGGGRESIRGHELNVLYASAKIVIGDTLCKNFDYPYYFSDRLFEVTGRGGFMIFPYIKGVEDMYDLNNELIPYHFNNFDQLEGLIDYYLIHAEKRERIRKAGFERVKKDHTYTNRLQYILDTLKL